MAGRQAAKQESEAVRNALGFEAGEFTVADTAPFNFNGLVRHYFMRQGANIADLQINLVPKGGRKAQSHDIARRIRPRVAAIAAKYGARVAVAEVPPGPPVLQTLVAEIYGPTDESRLALANKVIGVFQRTPGVVESLVCAILQMNQALGALDTREFGGPGATLRSHNADRSPTTRPR